MMPNSDEDPIASFGKSFRRNTALFSNSAALCLAIIYLCGYLIDSNLTRSFGIENIPIFKSQYIETGFEFIVISITLVILPFVTPRLIKRFRQEESASTQGIRSSAFLLINYCFMLLFFALFVTPFEWYAATPSLQILFGLTYTLRDYFLIYVVVILVFMLAISWLRRKGRQIENSSLRTGAHKTARILKTALFIYTIVFDLIVLTHISWLKEAIWAVRFYVLFLLSSMVWIYNLTLRLKGAKSLHTHALMLLVGGLFTAILLHLTLTAYSYSIYKFLPISRGGRLPVTQAILEIKCTALAAAPKLKEKAICKSAEYTPTVPLFIIEQNENHIYVTRKFLPFEEKTIEIYVFNHADIASILLTSSNVRNELAITNGLGRI